MNRDGDPVLDALARRMRDRGSPPRRDLWPDIEGAIDRGEQTRRRSLLAGRWRLVAAAAALAVAILGAGNLRGPGTESANVASTPTAEANDEDSVLTRALADLNAALRADPENIELSRLVLMVHQFRGDMLRRSGRAALLAR